MEINLLRKKKNLQFLDSVQGSKCHCTYVSIHDPITYYIQFTRGPMYFLPSPLEC